VDRYDIVDVLSFPRAHCPTKAAHLQAGMDIIADRS
jgi:hypothetical protein